jgi:shikimate 5-dehydrogenase
MPLRAAPHDRGLPDHRLADAREAGRWTCVTRLGRQKGTPVRFKDKVAFITGAGIGFGRAFAVALAAEGASPTSTTTRAGARRRISRRPATRRSR